jgi:hypothetical protein
VVQDGLSLEQMHTELLNNPPPAAPPKPAAQDRPSPTEISSTAKASASPFPMPAPTPQESRDERTVIALEQFLALVHVARAGRSA